MSDPLPTENRQVHLAELYPIIQETLSRGCSFRLTITGTSMVPTIRGGRDRVTLISPPERLLKFDLPLYRRANGAFVLHRVVDVAPDGSYVLCGDHQWIKEPGIRQEQIVALVSEIERKGKSFSVDAPHYRRWVRFWCAVLPLRRTILRVYRLPFAVKQKLFRKKDSPQ